MSRAFRLAWCVGAWFAGNSSLHAQAANAPAIELPPMLVEESVASAPWLYVNADGTEFLSRCSESTTFSLVEAWLAQLQLVRAAVPDEFLGRTDTPAVFVLHAQDLKQTVSAEIARELQGDRAHAGGEGVNIAPSMRLADSDMHASIAYIDEQLFNADYLSISPSHVSFLLKLRVPELPAWLVNGFERTWRGADTVVNPIAFKPLVWLNADESAALARDPARPRALLPAGELFAPDAQRAVENQNPRRLLTRTAQQALFVRWALGSGRATREALWKFAARAAVAPVTEAMFEECFGFDFAELRDRLSDFLPRAVDQTAWIDPGEPPPLPRLEVNRATPAQIARIRGEWERLAIGYVQRHLPQVRAPYIDQARRTLRRAYNFGERDPRLLATMGLCEIDADNDAGAREFLEPAVAAGVVRPRAYFELARIRFAALRRGAPESKKFSAAELAPVIGPLRRALTQVPQMHEVFTLLGEAWECCTEPPDAAALAELELGTQLFTQRPMLTYPTALVLARLGKKAEAAAALDACAGYPADEKTLAGIARLRAELTAALAQSPAAR